MSERIPPQGGLLEELLELAQSPFETNEWRTEMLKSNAEIIRLLQVLAGQGAGPPMVGGDTDVDLQTSDVFEFQGQEYVVPRVLGPEDVILVGNETYVEHRSDQYVAISDNDLTPGDREEFARIEVGSGEFLLWEKTAATAHDDLEYDYFVDNKTPDPDLSGNAPIATPDNLAAGNVMKDGYVTASDFVSLEIQNVGSSDVNDVKGLLKAVVMEIK